MNYEQKYKEALERAKYLKENTDSVGALDISTCFEQIFPELCESENERIRRELIRDIDIAMPIDTAQKYIAWLENQDEQKLCMIQWKGNNLKDVLDFTGKNKNFDKWFKSFEEFEKYVSEHNNIFKLFNSDGSHFEVPIGAWIIKTPDGYNVASKAIFKPKPADKVEPKFKVGDWVVDKHYSKTYQVFSIDNSEHNYYIVYSCKPLFNTDSDWPCFCEDMIRPWTIQDADDGDVLEFGDHGRLVVGIVSYVNKTTGKVDVNCLLENNNFKVGNYYNLDTIKPHPATEEQCDLLFQKMKDAGYEWDDEKMELKKIEQASTWSEEDERIRKDIVAAVETYGDFTQDRKEEIYAWLKKQDECKLLNKKIRGKDELFDHRYAQYLVEAMHQPYMIQWKGDNLKEVIDFTGKSKNFDEWFPSFEEFERYVHEHNNIFKLFNEDGSHFEIPVGAWIVKTPDGYNVASKAIFKNKPSCSEEDERIKSCIGMCLTDATEQRFKDFNTTLKDCLDWLEKHGEQKPVECIKFDNEFENQISHLIASVLNGEHEYNEGFVKYASQSLLGFAKKEQKSIEQDTEIRDLWVYIREWNEKFGRLPKDEDELAALIDYVTKRQKPAVIIPKFKVGDWIVYNRDDSSREIIQVYDIRDGRYYFTDNIHFSWSVKECDEKSHLWSIQDANDGDVLATKKGNPFIYDKNRYNNGLAYYYAGLGVNKELTLKSPHHMLDHFGELSSVFPATKEQRDLLFQKMKESGYEWDSEKKEIKKIEQESTWGEKIKGLNELEAYILSLVPGRSLDAIKVDAKNIRYIINKEQKPAWSEEDEKILNTLMKIIGEFSREKNHHWFFDEVDSKTITDWLKSLKHQYHWKPEGQQFVGD